MTKIKYINIDYDNNGIKLEKFIVCKLNLYNYTYLQKLIRTGQIRINKKRIKLGYTLKAGDILRLPIINKDKYLHTSKFSPIQKHKSYDELSLKEKDLINYLLKNILYQDQDILAISKPKGLPVQGGKGIKISLDSILYYFQKFLDIRSTCNLKIVHRLDKETSGVLLLAKTNAAAKHLFIQFKEQLIRKEYYCLVQGKINNDGVVNACLAKINNLNNQSIVNEKGKDAISEYKVMGISSKKFYEIKNITNNFHITFLKVLPKTGRNHQIRAHLGLVLNKPLIGDFKYGYKRLKLPFELYKQEIFLHAYSITFNNLENKKIKVISPLNERWINSLKQLLIL